MSLDTCRHSATRSRTRRSPSDALQTKTITPADRTRENRALTPDEIDKIVKAAEQRAVQKWRETHAAATDDELERLRLQGVYRGRVYLTLAYTGLRAGELRSLTWGELDLTEGAEIAEIAARKQKGKDDALIVIHPKLAELLRRHRKECSETSARSGRGTVRNSDRVFRVSSSLLRWLKLDAEWAGVGLTDARGRKTTVHGIRAGFNTTLRRNSTDPALRMRLMRHKSADLTLGTYDKADVDELRRELARMPVAEALAQAAGAECTTVPVTVPTGPQGSSSGRTWPRRVARAPIGESPNVARVRPSRPGLADAGRTRPEPRTARKKIGPAGLEDTAGTCARSCHVVPGSAQVCHVSELVAARGRRGCARSCQAVPGCDQTNCTLHCTLAVREADPGRRPQAPGRGHTARRAPSYLRRGQVPGTTPAVAGGPAARSNRLELFVAVDPDPRCVP